MEEIILEKYKNKLIDGKEISEFIRFELQQKIKNEKIKKNLAVILIGDNENSKTYIKLKKKFADFIGVGFNEYIISEEEIEQNILDAVNFLNIDEEVDGIIMQLPIPKKFNQDRILSSISRKKDVDGFLDETSFNPVLGKVIKRILIEYDDEFNKWENRNISIICNSDVFSSKIENIQFNDYDFKVIGEIMHDIANKEGSLQGHLENLDSFLFPPSWLKKARKSL